MRYRAGMAGSVQHRAHPTPRVRWPYLGRPQVLLLVAALVTMVASFLPWLTTGLGNASGAASGGMLTFYAGALGLAGVFWRHPRVVAGHVLALAVVNIAVPAWRLAWALRTLPGFGQAWIPGPGVLLVLISGVAAAIVLVQLRPLMAQGTRSPPGPPTTR
jgi:hypothetical protein